MKRSNGSSIETQPESGSGEVRLGPALAIPAVLSDMGVDPGSVFTAAGVALRDFHDPDRRVPMALLGRLLDVCVRRTGCPHFGLLVGMRFQLRQMGALGDVVRHAPTVGAGLRSLLQYLHFQDRAAVPLLLVDGADGVILGYSLIRPGTPGARQLHDAVVGIEYRILAELCGAGWRALRVQLSHARPASTAAHRRAFGADVVFDAGFAGVAFAASWLERPVAGADPALRARALVEVQAAEALRSPSLGEQVRGALHQLVLGGAVTAAEVASRAGLSERSLRRHLQGEGVSLRQLLAQTRFGIAQQLLESTRLDIADIASGLQYRNADAFSRAFRGWAGQSPTAWRAARSP